MQNHFHLLPGRLRLSVPGLLYNQARADELAKRLGRIPGVKLGYVNPVSGRVLVYYEEKKVSLDSLLKELLSSSKSTTRKHISSFKTKSSKAKIPKFGVSTKEVHMQSQAISTAWHTLSTEKLLSIAGTSKEVGLPLREAERRLQRYGPNQLQEKPPQSPLAMVWESLNGFMSKLLLAAAGVSVIVGEASDAVVIVAIVLLQGVIEAVQGHRAEKSLLALKQLSAPTAKVLREGKLLRVPASRLVPGDIITLEAGDRVPADARLLKISSLSTDEACLTGESVPIFKSAAPINNAQLTVADRTNMIFAGTNITGGRAVAVVVATGMNSEMGKIATMLSEVENSPTILQRQMERLGKKVTQIVVLSVSAIAIINLIQGRPLIEILRTGVSLAVGAIPEGLPAVVTVSLAAGVQRMVRRNAVVRRLPAVETLGSATVICTDKTGTLTQNEMTVKQVFTGNRFYLVTGDGYQPNGQFVHNGHIYDPQSVSDVQSTLQIGALCNNAELRLSEKNTWEVIGDPTEGALLTAAAKAGLWWQDLRQSHIREREIAFDSARRMMTVICNSAGSSRTYVKGAPDTVINCCTKVLQGGKVVPLDSKGKRRILAANELLASQALRVLAMAYKEIPEGNETDSDDLEQNLIFSGLMGMVDPPRAGVKASIRKCHSAKVKVVMITGDHQKTAEAVAKKLGIMQRGTSITGEDLDKLSDKQLQGLASSIVVYSRTSPDQKLRIVRALKKRGYIVAMTGDGVNDAPAVKEADIGVAMGLSGTDVTREAAGITLSDDNFATIVAGIEEGRTVGDNLSKSVRYVLSGNLGQVLAVFLAAVFGLPTPLLPPQILWINLVTEGLPAMALTGDPPHPACMRRPPVKPETRFLANNGTDIVRRGVLIGLSTFGVYAGGMEWANWSPLKARTMAFSHLVIGRVFNLFDSRRSTNAGGILRDPNSLILPAAGLSAGMLMLTMYAPFLRPFFSTVPIGLADWALISVTAGLVGRTDKLLGRLLKPRSAEVAKPKLLRPREVPLLPVSTKEFPSKTPNSPSLNSSIN